MSSPTALPAFAACGVELEYMIVDRERLGVLPVADRLLVDAQGRCVCELPRGPLGWSNELVSHLIEIKTGEPVADLAGLPEAFGAEVARINALLDPLGGRLMPTAMHPWMDPRSETRLWQHEHREIYAAYDRIFDCRRHGWANLQSIHVNLPFSGDREFGRLHAAVRAVLPILPALAASSPIADGRRTAFMDTRMEAYRTHPDRVPSLIGEVIPETVSSRRDYERRILGRMYADIAPLDPDGVLRHEWLNCRGAIPRFARSAIEIRVLDVQECPLADLAVATAVAAVVRAIYEERWARLETQQALPTRMLAGLLARCARHADEAVIGQPDYLRLLGFPAAPIPAGELWRRLIDAVLPGWNSRSAPWRIPLSVLLEHGTLARRIVRAAGPDGSRSKLEAVYRQLCDCLAQNRMFVGLE